ncbi:MAG: F-box-like domain-containing protein, partial [Parachlamydiaceae bacterium]|nr:F-box-like domain-containing protein [Parachlamydiaceae bacterium]
MNVSSLKNYNNYNNKIFLSFNGGLPTKVFEQILSYLNPKDHESAVLVSKYWYKIGKNYAQKEEYRSFKYLTAFLINNIDSVLYPIIIKKLQKILKKNEFFQSLNLIQLKPLLFEDLRDEIFNILKDLSENSLEKLYIYERKSRLANDLFYLLKVHKRIDGLYKVGFMHFSSVISRDQFFVKLSQEMALNRFKEEGVRLILKIKSPDLRIKALYDMIVNSNKNRVEEIINKIPDLKSSFIQALKLVSNENLNVENPDKNQSHKFQNLIVKSTIDENQNKKAWVNELHLDVLEMGLRSWEFSVELA